MCRSIRPLNNYEPPATDDEVQAAALQFVRKVSGGRDPSQANREAFEAAVASIAETTRTLVDSLVTSQLMAMGRMILSGPEARGHICDRRAGPRSPTQKLPS